MRKARGWSLRHLERISGVSNTAISHIETGKQTNPTTETIKRLADAFGVTPDYLLGRTEHMTVPKGSDNDIERLPIVGHTHAGDPTWAEEAVDGWITLPKEELRNGGPYFCLRVEGDSMTPLIPDGALIVVRQQPTVENGEIAVVLWPNDNMAHVRRVFRDDQRKVIILQAENRTYPPITRKPGEVKILGRVVKVLSDIAAAVEPGDGSG